ncbi:MAG: hypothetical protein HYV65_03535 [Candidatus Spechtbacteria bacterium]|nr:hypothetical protein [Candidatus Spechtbacteria bacterium]
MVHDIKTVKVHLPVGGLTFSVSGMRDSGELQGPPHLLFAFAVQMIRQLLLTLSEQELEGLRYPITDLAVQLVPHIMSKDSANQESLGNRGVELGKFVSATEPVIEIIKLLLRIQKEHDADHRAVWEKEQRRSIIDSLQNRLPEARARLHNSVS